MFVREKLSNVFSQSRLKPGEFCLAVKLHNTVIMLILLDVCCVLQVWPHSDYPLIPVGKLVLNRNPVNYFAEVEQMAYDPSNMPPGIEPSPDKMLQVTRRFGLRSTGYFAAHESFELTCPSLLQVVANVCDQCFRDACSHILTLTDTAWAPTISRSL